MRSTGSRLCLLIAFLLALAAPGAGAQDIDAIRAKVFDYLEGINEVNRERLESAFDPGAALKSVGENGTLKVEPIADAIGRWMQGAPGSRRGEILSIDVTDGQIARVVFDYDGAYLDFLTLAKIRGDWKIIDKVFVKR